MSVLLWTLVYATFLPIVWSIVGGAQRARQPEGFNNTTPRSQAASLTGMGERAYAAHQNAWEALMMYTPAVMIATFTGADGQATATTGIVFCVARTLHGILYCTNQATLRSLVWFVGIGCTIRLIVLAA
ncbi:MAG: MAPEG family protein [Pseudomonadota bacterium]